MMKRLFALVIALAVVSAPVAAEVCHITCESKGMRAACHEHGDTSQELTPVNDGCDHGADAPPSLVAARNSGTAVSLLATVPPIDSVILAPTRDFVSMRTSASADPRGIPLAIPLRV
ncbi:MAG TPA: hypothetical protein VKE51_00470 [Vicinamibacterales bacterium]|nr:hypothetical protein [Vicinamibacterales bacterium]